MDVSGGKRMPTIPIDLPEQARRGLARLGLDDAALAVIGAGDDFVESEKAFRQGGRLEAVGADAARVNVTKEREERFNRAGIRQMERALAELERAPDKLDSDTRRQIRESTGTPEFRDRLRESQALFKDNLVSADISGAEAEEVVGLWNEAQTALEEGGFDELLARGREMAQQAREARERPNKGREPHSPLAIWKYAIIAGAIVVGVAAVIACFIWFACSWVVALLGFWGTAGGWIIAMINQGCAPIPESA
jgi:hypothetical protein